MPVEKVKLSNTRGCDSKASATKAADVVEGAQRVGAAQSNRVSPKKLFLSKWTAVHPERKEKHFLVTKVFEPEIEGQAIVEIELEAAMTGRKFCMPWRELKNREHWRQGWL
jgi:tryptophan-rich hypothetical protein